MTDYTGAVSPGGPADVRELADLTIAKVAVDPEMSNNCYLLTCRSTGDRVLIDAADDATTLLAMLGGGEPRLSAVVTTHQHWDHHRALAEVTRTSGATTYAGARDAGAIEEQTGVTIAHCVGDGDTVPVGACTLEVITISGHTPGSICLLYRDPGGHPHLFTGDSLFPGGVGKTWSDDDFATLIDQVSAKIFDLLPDHTWFYPGHGEDSTLGEQRPHLAQWRERGW